MWVFFKREMPFFLAIPAVLWQIVFMFIPLLLTIYASVHDISSGAYWYQSTFVYYTSIMTYDHGMIIGHSLVMAFITMVCCLCLGYPVAYFIALYAGQWRNVLFFLLTLPFWTNFLTQAYAWFFVLDRSGLINTILMKLHIISEPFILVYSQCAVLCVMVYCFLPFMIMPLYTILQKLDWQLLEASQDLGATRWQTFWHITVPLSYSGIKTGCLLVFIPACGEFVIPMIMGGSRYMFIGSAISHYFLAARNAQLGAAFTVMSGLVVFVCILIFLLCMNIFYRPRYKRWK